jgi:RHS repeat-associated protein
MHGLDNLLSVQDELGVTTYLHTDPSGTLVAASTSAGGLSAEERRNPFGVPEGTTLGVGIGFMGREEDTEAGLQFFRSRYYDPTLGRFVSEDPARFAGGRNFYEAFEANPLRYVDPLGLLASITCADAKQVTDAGAAAADAAKYCLSCQENEQFQRAHNNANVTCSGQSGLMDKMVDGQVKVKCATARASTNLITLNNEATNGSCGCLEATMFHEILHLLPVDMKYKDDPGDQKTAEEKTQECIQCSRSGSR